MDFLRHKPLAAKAGKARSRRLPALTGQGRNRAARDRPGSGRLPMPIPIDFYFSIDSRYSYLAATQIPLIEREFGAEFRWHPLGLAALLDGARRDALQRWPARLRPV